MEEMNNNVMENENNEVEMEERTGAGAGVGFLIGSLVTAGVIVGAKTLKKLYTNHKAKKAAKEAEEIVEGEVVDEKPVDEAAE